LTFAAEHYYLPIEKWHLIGDPTIADAICDRLIHNAYRLKLTGESMRKIKMEHKIKGGVCLN